MEREQEICPIKRVEPYLRPINGVVQPPIEPPLNRPGRSTNQLDFLSKKLDIIIRHPDAFLFREPVNTITLKVPTYYDVIASPMDLNTVKQRLFNKYYWSAEEAIDDIELIFSNCFIFNHPDSHVANMGRSLKQFFITQLDEMPQHEFEISDSPIRLRDKQIKRKSDAQCIVQSVPSSGKNQLINKKKMQNGLPPLMANASSGMCANIKRNKVPKAAAIKGPPKKRGRPRKIVMLPLADGTMPKAAPPGAMLSFKNYTNCLYAPAVAAVGISKNGLQVANKTQQFAMPQTHTTLQSKATPTQSQKANVQSNPDARATCTAMSFNQKLRLVEDWEGLTTDQMYCVDDIVKRMEKNLKICEEVDVDHLKPATLWAIYNYIVKCKTAQMQIKGK